MVFISKVNNYMFLPKAAIFRLSQLQTNPTNPHPPTQRENHKHYTCITDPHKLPPPNTYPTKQIQTPPFIDPLDIPLDKVTCNT